MPVKQVRQTRDTNGFNDSAFVACDTSDRRWTISPPPTFAENVATFYERFNISVEQTMTLTAKLAGALSARASFLCSKSLDPAARRMISDIANRVTLVYSC